MKSLKYLGIKNFKLAADISRKKGQHGGSAIYIYSVSTKYGIN